ncbi:MAG: B12-binding domain-containing radical SAM protein [Clostridia bacterium]|nr:B12-binding domain-containing radical SAM protein [Clostridia bacterium]
MNVLFINPKTEIYSRSVTAPLGLLSIASFLQAKGFSVRIFDRTVQKRTLEEVLAEFEPELVGISLVSYYQYHDACDLSRRLRARGTQVIWGGALASCLPQAVLNTGLLDAISIGEGEQTWLELATAKQKGQSDLTGIKGLALRDADGKMFFTAQREFVDLATLPDIDWSLVEVEKYFQTTYGCKRMLYLYAAKGCPFNCAFCYNKEFHRCTYRKRPMDSLLREIKYLVQNHGMDGVYFADELFCRNVKEMHETCDALQSLGLNFVWGGQTRIGIFKEEDFRYMFNAGCRWIFFGVESGSKRMLKQMNKRIDYDKIEQTFAACQSAGIVAIGSLIIGLPGETEADARETVALIERLHTPLINLNYYMVVPGSDYHQQLLEEGKYPVIEDVEEFNKYFSMQQKLLDNYSDLPAIDMKVIRAVYMWRSFRTNDLNVGGERFSFTKKVITDALKSVKTGDLKGFIISSWDAGLEFLRTFYYAHFYRKVKQKYGIR